MARFKAFRRKQDGNGFLTHDKLRAYPEGSLIMLEDKDLEMVQPWLDRYFDRLPELDSGDKPKAVRVRRNEAT